MNGVISTKIYDLLKNVVNGNIEDYSISVHDPNKKGEGYLGEMCYVSLTDKISEKSFDFIVKQAFSDEDVREAHPIRRCYLNEIRFYTNVWPYFKKIQTNRSLANPFDKIPKCFITSAEFGHEKLIFENLKYQNFQTYDKKKPFDESHIKFILKQYGKFHAISFACKQFSPEKYNEITKDLEDLLADMAARQLFKDFGKYVCEISLDSLDPQKDAKAIEKFKVYPDSASEEFCRKMDYPGDYSVVLHGDCWSNNMMFKYNESKQLHDVRLLDFQLAKIGTPVFDLSYFLYSGGNKEIFDQLDHYLRVYHDTLLETLEEFGLNSEHIYPFEALKRDWKEYCFPGFIMGLMLWRNKLTYADQVKDLTDMKDDISVFTEMKFDVEGFNERARDLILHMSENDFL